MQCSGVLIKNQTLSKKCKGYYIRKHDLEVTILTDKGEKKQKEKKKQRNNNIDTTWSEKHSILLIR